MYVYEYRYEPACVIFDRSSAYVIAQHVLWALETEWV